MSNQPLTRESFIEEIRETSRQFSIQLKEQGAKFDREMQDSRAKFDREMQDSRAEFDRRMQEADKRAQEADRRSAELDRQMQKTSREVRRTTRNVNGLSSSVGRLVESMVASHIEEKFQAFDYGVMDCARNFKFGSRRLGTRGEIDLYLIDGDVEILIEVKTTLETADVRKHIERMEKFRRHIDGKGKNIKRFIGAVAGATVEEEAKDFAHENGMYVIVQSGEAVEIIPVPDGFRAKEW